jgi:hypothetical protein
MNAAEATMDADEFSKAHARSLRVVTKASATVHSPVLEGKPFHKVSCCSSHVSFSRDLPLT